MTQFKTILDFWFHEAKSPQERMALWFGGEEKTDEKIRKKFEADVVAAAAGKYQNWETQADSCLALIILLDQFSLNIYRGKPKSFEVNALALPVALHALEQGYDQKASVSEKLFYYLPLEHSEDLKLQNRAMELFKKMVKESPPNEKEAAKTFLHFAKLHQEVIARFGRFPDRNEILGRPHTPEEAEYMRLGGPDF
jgi:uncharacterized protein (DUF924 family)